MEYNPYKMVLRRKRGILSTNIQWNDKNQGLFKRHGLLIDSMLEPIKNEASNFCRIAKFLELMQNQNEVGFKKLCVILQEDHKWICDELQAEYKAETGQLVVEPFIAEEARYLVKRQFGKSKIINEKDKKEMAALVALRTQYAKEVWRTNFDKTKNALDDAIDENNKKDGKIAEVYKMVEEFVRIHQSRMKTKKAADVNPNADADDDEEKALIDKTEIEVDKLIELTSACLSEKDELLEEKTKTLKILGTEDLQFAKMDVEINNALEKVSGEIKVARDEARRREKEVEDLENDIKRIKEETEREIRNREIQIKNMKAHLETCHCKITELHANIEDLKRQLLWTKEESERFRIRAEQLDRNRKMGFIIKNKD